MLVLIASSGLLTSCGQKASPPIPSPDGSMNLVTSVERRREDPGAYLCVVFEIHDPSGKTIHRENTRASSTSRWKMGWKSNDEIFLESGDIGDYVWIRAKEGAWTKR